MIPKKPHLTIGKAYFMCGYYLRRLPIPEVETWIYIGANIFEENEVSEEQYHYFEDPDTYFSKEISEENDKYKNEESVESKAEQHLPQRLRVADNEIEGLVYDYQDLRKWVLGLEKEPNADKVF